MLLAAAVLACGRAHGECLELPDSDLRSLAALEDVDATQALARARALIAAAQDDHAMPPLRRAALYAIAAQSSSVLELDADARADALRGLALTPADDNPVYLSLLVSYAESVYDTPGLQQPEEKLSAPVARLPVGSVGHVCVLGALGWMQHRLNRDDLAVVTLTNAYRETAPPRLAHQRARAAEALAAVMDGMGDFDQALDLIQVALDWEQAQGAQQAMSITRYVRGQVLLEKGDARAALVDFDAARTMARALGDRQGVAYADLRRCEARIRLGQDAAAMADCETARAAFAAAGVKDMVKQAQALQARADLDRGRNAAALATLNAVLDHNGADIVPHAVPDLFELRARANAAAGNYTAAYADLHEYVQRSREVNEADRARSGSVLRARFRVDSEVERNALLQRELALTRERSALQRDQLDRRADLLVAGAALILLLSYILLSQRGLRRQLQRIATEDSLTKLPNRRRTAELATAALDAASAGRTPLVLALVDLDHFKLINDACGHAVGDRVLQELAALSRSMLREGEVMGRWGGEEFLLLLPAQPLEAAVARVEALRVAALDIGLPPSAAAAALRVSLSAGLASSYEGASSLDEIIARADVALYEAKRHGRNQVRVADESLQASSTAVRRALRAAHG
ncbi:MAG TPA: GGDEF domain-containing protein [Steroidobacteraceae bacterium]|nr:GGDEF domain-containing protein [Steroidobacteraceae bacterium]